MDQSNRALFTIVIPTWNNLALLQLCIGSIRKNSRHTHQIVVHVNQGTDGTLEWIKDQGIEHTYTAENCGVCYAVNLAAAKANTDYIAYINDDMYVCPDWDHYLWEAIQLANTEMFYYSSTAIEPIDVGKKCAITHNYGRTIECFNESKLLLEYAQLPFYDWNGSSWPPSVVHRNTWIKVGGYSPEFFPGFYSDPDFTMKLWQLGVRDFRGISKSRVYHFLEQSTNKLKAQLVKNSSHLFLHKWGITANAFYKFYLKMGEKYSGPVQEPKLQGAFRRKVWAGKLKRLFV